MAAKDIEVKVKYIPDTSALKSALDNTQKIDFKIGGSNLKKELLSPVQNAMKEVNKALANGADSTTLLKLFKDVGAAADVAKNKAQGMLTELNSVYNSAGNQKLLKDLEQYQKELQKTEKEISNWDKKYGNKVLGQMKSDLGVSGVGDARKKTAELEEQVKVGKVLTQQEQDRLNLLKQYINAWNGRQTATPKGELEAKASALRANIKTTEDQVQTSSFNVQSTKEYANIIALLGQYAGLSTQEINKLTAAIKNQDAVAEKGKKELTKFGDVLTGTFLGTTISNLAQTALQRGIDFFKDYDETLTRTMMVTGMARDEVNGLTDSYNRLANQLVSTTKDVAAAQLVFYQQGLSTNESLAMTEASIAISKTGGIEASEAANRLTAAVRGYQLAANEAMDIADKMSALDAAAASSVDELTIAMQKSASQARMAGLDLDYYMAYLSTMQEVTREAPENIGTAMKSITSRMQEIRDIGKIEEDGTTFSNVAKALNSIGIAATDSSGQLRSLQDIMNELGPMWANLDRNHKAYIATTLAGNRQQSRFIALMDNYDRALELVNVSQNANGETAKQLRAYNQGLEASLEKLTNAWQQFATKIVDSDTIKSVVDALTDLLDTINSLPKGLLKTAAGFIALSKGMNVINTLKTVDFKGWLGDITGISKHIKEVEKVSTATANAQKGYKGLVDSTKQWFNTLLGGQATVTNSIASQTGLSASIETTNTVRGEEIAIKEADNGTDIQEVQENKNIENSQKALGDAIETTNEALRDQNDIYNNNGSPKLAQMQADQHKLRAELKDLQNRRKNLKQENRAAIEDFNAKYASARSGYEAAAKDPNALRSEAERLLVEEGLISDKQQMTLFPDMAPSKKEEKMIQTRMEELRHQYGVWYREVQDDLEAERDRVFDKNNPLISDLDDQIKSTKEKLKSGAADISKLQQEIEEKNEKERKKSQRKKPSTKKNNNNINGDNEGQTSQQGLMGAIIQPYVIKSVAEMGASMLGLSENVSSAVGGFASLGSVGLNVAKTLKTQFAKAGKQMSTLQVGAIAAGAAIAGMALSLIASINSLESINEKLDKTLSKRDSVQEKKAGVEKSLKTYEELSRKIVLSEEEQNELNAAANNLADLLPTIVSGYDNAGNAIISAVAAQQQLNELKAEESKLSNEALDLYDKKTRAANKTSGWEVAGNLLPGLVSAGATIGTMIAPGAGTAIGAGIGAVVAGVAGIGVGIYNAVTAADDLKDALIEDREAIVELLDATTQVPAGLEGLKATIIDNVYSQALEEEFGVEEMQKRIEAITSKLNQKGVSGLIRKMQFKVQDPNLNYSEFKDDVINGLKSLGFSDEQIDLTFDGIVNLIFDGRFNYHIVWSSLKAKLDSSGISDELEKGLKEVLRLDQRLLEALYNAGLLDDSFIEHVLSKYSAEQINDMFFKDGQYDPYAAIGTLIEEGYTSIEEKEKRLAELEQENIELEEYVNQVVDDYNRNWVDKPGAAQGYWAANPTYPDTGKVREGDPTAAKYQEYLDGTITADDYKDYVFDYIDSSTAMTDAEKENAKTVASLIILQKEKSNQIEKNKKEIEGLTPEIQNLNGVNEELINQYRQMNAMPTFQQMADGINQAISPLKDLNDVLKEVFEHNGNITFDSLISLLEALQKIQDMSLEAGISTKYFNQACMELANGLSIENGMIHMNMSATEMMQTVAAATYRAQMEQMANKISANMEEMKMQRDMLDAEIKFMEEELLTAETGAEAEKKVEENLKGYLEGVHVAAVKATSQRYKDELVAAEAYYSQLTAMQIKAAKGEQVKAGEFTGIFDNLVRGVGESIKQDIDFDDDQNWKAQVQARINSLKEQRNLLDDNIKGQGALKEKLMQFATDPNLDLGKMLGNGMDAANDSLDDYIGKLERTFNLIQKIDRLQHAISDNNNLKDLYKDVDGKKYADALLTELDLMGQQYEERKALFEMQQEELGKQRGKIEDSPYAGLFSFDSNDLIQIDWDTYNAMSNQDKEEIDILVERYEELQGAVEDTEIEMAEYAKTMKESWEEVRDTIIDAENEICDALKNREKIMHEARTKALDDEIEMIEKAVEARQKAREEEENEKDLYKAQEALRRATLDSSGKNNASLLQLQQDLEEKQLEISEKRFEDDMEDRKNWLQDCKDAETESYEYRLETMTWYWENVQEIMNSGTENIMTFLMQWNEQYRVQSETEQDKTKMGWQAMYDSIQELYSKGWDLSTFHAQMDSVVADLEAQQINIQSIATEWQQATKEAQQYMATINNGKINSMIGSGYTGNTGDTGKGDVDDPVVPEYSGNMKKGDKIEFKPVGGNGTTVDTFNEDGTKTGSSIKDPTGYDKNYKAGDIKRINNQWMVDIGSGVYVPVKHFQKPGGWGEADTRYYASGGIVDYTGPAWVDGTKTKPEAFLNPYQTEQIAALAGALDGSTINSASMNSNVTFGSINFNVASMSSAADGKKALEMFVQGANDLMAKKGIGTKLNMNVK